MTQEDKELLLKDLCARLPYNILMNGKLTNNVGRDNIDFVLDSVLLATAIACGCKPYLRLMSSMTEEESKEFALLQTDFYVDGFLYPIAAINMVNWLNEHHFDYHGLIEKGLALEASEGMYK